MRKGGAGDEENGNYSIVNGGAFFDRRSILWRQNRCLPRKSPILSGFFATQTAIFLCAETQM